jgi:3'-5' exoribonuclease
VTATRTPREFCGESFPWPGVGELRDGGEVVACYVVHEKERRETRERKPFLRLKLGDRTGTVEAVVWEDAERLDPLCPPEAAVGVRARVGAYRDRPQLTITRMEPVRLDPADMELFLPASPRDRRTMERELDLLVSTVEDRPLRALLRRCVGARTALGQSFRAHPAAMRKHHAYVGGLLEHSLSLAQACDSLAAHYRGQGYAVDRDLLVAGALLHDIGKVREIRAAPGFQYTTPGNLLGHIVLGIHTVAREAEAVEGLGPDRLGLLLHLVASHQGKPEWGSPARPQTLEAIILHQADHMDALLNEGRAALDGLEPGEWSRYLYGMERSLLRTEAPDPSAREDDGDDTMELFPG